MSESTGKAAPRLGKRAAKRAKVLAAARVQTAAYEARNAEKARIGALFAECDAED
jgi:hypothetical protein